MPRREVKEDERSALIKAALDFEEQATQDEIDDLEREILKRMALRDRSGG